MRLHLVCLSMLMLGQICFSQSREFKVVSYNSLRYSPTNIDARHPDYRMIMNDIQPDILLLEELSGLSAAEMFRDSVMNIDSSTYTMASFINGNGLDVALYFKTAKFTFISTSAYPTQLRAIYHFKLLPADFFDTLHVFGVHLKASSGSSNEALRADEVDTLRKVTNALPIGSNFIIGGDFNIYKSTEPAYQALLQKQTGAEGHFVDTIKLTGTWNNSSYAPYHTQSPRTIRFGGGANGGLDDRFDLILMSQAIASPSKISYVANSMNSFGNDGQHYNVALTDAPANTAVSVAMAQALHDASDHLPVEASFSYQPVFMSLTKELSDLGIFVAHSDGKMEIFNNYNIPFEGDILAPDGRVVKTIDEQSQLINISPGFYLILIRVDGDHSVFVQKIIQP